MGVEWRGWVPQTGCRSVLSGVWWLTIPVRRSVQVSGLMMPTVMAGNAEGVHMSSCSFFTLPLLPPTLLPVCTRLIALAASSVALQPSDILCRWAPPRCENTTEILSYWQSCPRTKRALGETWAWESPFGETEVKKDVWGELTESVVLWI